MKKTISQRASVPVSEDAMNAREATGFIAGLSGELASIANKHRFDTLAYLLDMARMEAENLHREMDGS